ncbi:histone-like nucleoid-structuring protein Lsr2 [Rhodococcus sp. P1Y]|uniref:histone-like nucleoid-structuring protein Lsr2 n=1 Tax=Rhodococcus sp. P1Y TaxID=1302308 RepID=UPI000EAD842E|nr:Lsr2 family protein [Rhodococcus sp. P1Y]AYJ50293.1 Lsr2 family protein [Rhodococcus sp. P1Y]
MAKKVSVELVDDLDGSVIDDGTGETIEFSVAGVDYVIDLKSKNAAEFHRKVGYYIDHAARTGGRRHRPKPAGSAPTPAPKSTAASASTRDPADTRAIRQWAADEGYDIGDRGRIPASIVDAYDAAH